MAKAKRGGLGIGLEALIPEDVTVKPAKKESRR